MNSDAAQLIADLNHHDAAVRLASLRRLMVKIANRELERPAGGKDVNNHIHTIFSFSPYSPAKAVWMAYNSGLATAGLMDHDSIAGAREFIEAGKIAGIATTIGLECRVNFSKTPLQGRRINNPDQDSIAYIAIHGIPHTQIDKVSGFFQPLINCRNIRNRKMTHKLNEIFEPWGIKLDFAKDIIPVSQYPAGGTITERHILYALSLKLIEHYPKGTALVSFLKEKLELKMGPKIEGYLTDGTNPYYVYDLLGLLKAELTGSFYIDATSECPDAGDVIRFAAEIGAITAYAYLGDVGDSVTGDKKAQKFEDGYLDLLFEVLKDLKFNAITYMPSRNSMEQLERIREKCVQYGFFQISGEDINSPRQSFICQALRQEKFQNLFDAAWALIGHEIVATEQPGEGLFSASTIKQYPQLEERIKLYREIGLSGKSPYLNTRG